MGMFVRIVTRTSRLVAERLKRTVVTLHQPVNILPGRSIQCSNSSDAVLYRILDKILPVTFLLCYLTHAWNSSPVSGLVVKFPLLYVYVISNLTYLTYILHKRLLIYSLIRLSVTHVW